MSKASKQLRCRTVIDTLLGYRGLPLFALVLVLLLERQALGHEHEHEHEAGN